MRRNGFSCLLRLHAVEAASPAGASMFVSSEESEALRAWRHSKLVERKGFIMNRFPSRRINRRLIRIAAVVSLVLLTRVATAADFTVTSPGSFFSINGQTNPKLTLIRGKTYTFAVNTACGSHPFKINSLGVTNNNICSGTLTYTVPLTFSNYQYICSIHFFGSTIETIPPPPAPTINIVGLSVGTNVTLLSTGTNTWSLVPEFSTNFSTTNWFALNRTNESVCKRHERNDLWTAPREPFVFPHQGEVKPCAESDGARAASRLTSGQEVCIRWMRHEIAACRSCIESLLFLDSCGEKPIKLEQTPAAVRKTIEGQIAGGKLIEITQDDDKGDVSYATQYRTKSGQDREFTVGQDGSLLRNEVGIEELSPELQKAIRGQAGEAKIESIEKSMEDGEVSYDVSLRRKNGEGFFTWTRAATSRVSSWQSRRRRPRYAKR
jgi:hypothetical protein